MNKKYSLEKEQKEKIIKAVRAALACPLIDSIEDYIWESIFCYTKGIPIVDPISNTRSKKLFDVVDRSNKIGWSAKALQSSIPREQKQFEFELVIQRADVFSLELGLTKNSKPDEIGAALLEHWHKKIKNDSAEQGVKDKRVCILLKSRDNKQFAYFEEDLAIYKANEIKWEWTNMDKKGLQGIRTKDQKLIYRWYPSQKQLFEHFFIPANYNYFKFEIDPKRIDISETIDLLYGKIK